MAALWNVAVRDICEAHGEEPPWKSCAPVMTHEEYALIIGKAEWDRDFPPEF